jgi:hypothetical protein
LAEYYKFQKNIGPAEDSMTGDNRPLIPYF